MSMRKYVGVAALALLLSGCASSGAGLQSPAATVSPTPDQLFARSLDAAAVPGPADIGPGLLRIASDNPALSWRDAPEGRQVLMASTMSTSSYQKYYEGKPTGGPTGWGQIWVTAVPQLREFCSAAPGDATAKINRVVQWLGLNPTVPYAQVVEMWVPVDQLVRPCPITDITAKTCTLDTADQWGPPAVAGTASRPVCTAGDGACTERQSYWDWFATNMRLNLKEGGAPWTRLGYTFDWKPDAKGDFVQFGASEFVLKPTARYEVKTAYSLADYCAAPGS